MMVKMVTSQMMTTTMKESLTLLKMTPMTVKRVMIWTALITRVDLGRKPYIKIQVRS